VYVNASPRLIIFVSVIIVATIAYFFLSAPSSFDIRKLKLLKADPVNGEYVYRVAGCSGCHLGEGKSKKNYLAGGQRFETNFGTFVAPNISNSKIYGIGNWNFKSFYGAVKFGQSPEGMHYFPAFPYTTYIKMTDQDVLDLWSFWKTLPSVDVPSKKHELNFPFNIRLNIGIWKRLYLSNKFVDATPDRATYIVEALGHCAECHTPRGIFGGLKESKWMLGAENPSGEGKIPPIHPSGLRWNKKEIVEYLSSGFTPDFDVAGGKMASIIEQTSKLTSYDLDLIADYLLRLQN
jgi:mono/diheme cytochrome c family protein